MPSLTTSRTSSWTSPHPTRSKWSNRRSRHCSLRKRAESRQVLLRLSDAFHKPCSKLLSQHRRQARCPLSVRLIRRGPPRHRVGRSPRHRFKAPCQRPLPFGHQRRATARAPHGLAALAPAPRRRATPRGPLLQRLATTRHPRILLDTLDPWADIREALGRPHQAAIHRGHPHHQRRSRRPMTSRARTSKPPTQHLSRRSTGPRMKSSKDSPTCFEVTLKSNGQPCAPFPPLKDKSRPRSASESIRPFERACKRSRPRYNGPLHNSARRSSSCC